jgi:hypothetical protein
MLSPMIFYFMGILFILSSILIIFNNFGCKLGESNDFVFVSFVVDSYFRASSDHVNLNVQTAFVLEESALFQNLN